MNHSPEQGEEGSTGDTPELFTLKNGLQVVCLSLPYVEYVAMDLLLPGGVIHDPEGQEGSALLISELLSRGAGSLSSQELLCAFDSHGIRHGEAATLLNSSLRLSCLPDQCEKAVELLATMIQEPTFPEEALEPVKSLFLQDLRSVRENPSRWAMLELSKRFFPDPYNKSSLGTESGIRSVGRDSLATQWKERFGPQGAILSVAGRCDVSEVRSLLEEALGAWRGACEEIPSISVFPQREKYFIEFPGSQQQLVLKYPSAPMGAAHYYTAKVFSQILSGGMFGRLFIEVREKRGLCYTVYAQHSGRPEFGTLTVYAGTTPERVAETYEVISQIFENPLEGLTDEELMRAKNNLLSQIVLSEESTAARSRSNAADWLFLRRIRSLREIQEAVLAVDRAMLEEFLHDIPLRKPAAITLGAKNFGNWTETTSEFAHDAE
jgi:predicted Zn-dependent peptidase